LSESLATSRNMANDPYGSRVPQVENNCSTVIASFPTTWVGIWYQTIRLNVVWCYTRYAHSGKKCRRLLV